MNETNKTNISNLSPIVQQAVEMGMGLGVEAQRREELAQLIDYSSTDSLRSANRANWTREHPRSQLSLGRKALLSITAVGAAVLTPQGKEVAGTVVDKTAETVSAAIDRVDDQWRGPDNERSLPENPSDMEVTINPDKSQQA